MVVAFGEESIDAKGAGDSEGELESADKVFNVA